MVRMKLVLAAGALMLAATPAQAGLFGLGSKDKKPAQTTASAGREEAYVREIRRAIDEQRHSDAGKLLDRAFAAGMSDPRLMVLTGELHLARGQNEDALARTLPFRTELSVCEDNCRGVTLVLGEDAKWSG